MRRILALTLFAALLASPAAAQITPTFTFTSGTVISSTEVNTNFALFANALNRTGGTMTGTLIARQITPSADATYDVGTVGARFRDGFFSRDVAIAGTATLGTASVTTFTCTGCVSATQLASTTVTPASYLAADFTVDADGRLTAASSAPAMTAVAFSAGDYTASDSMTWTVAIGDAAVARYIQRSHMMEFHLTVLTTTVGGTPSDRLRVKIPNGKTATSGVDGTFWYYDNGTAGVGFWNIAAGGTVIEFFKGDLSNWTASTDNTHIRMSGSFEVN